jgi:phage gpG-like protein
MNPVSFDAAPLLSALGRLSSALAPEGLSDLLAQIGEHLTQSTKKRFVTSQGPDGQRWAPNAQATYLSYLARHDNPASLMRKDGRVNTKGARALANKKPLVDSGLLAHTITWQKHPQGKGVEVGTHRFSGEWAGGAAVHQFGSRDDRIPARPFLGLSSDDQTRLLDLISRHLKKPLS